MSPDIARLRIETAVRFFEAGTGDPIRDRLELFRALNNLIAIELKLGLDRDAFTTARRSERLVLDMPEGIPRLDVLASNVVLAGVRSQTMTLLDAVVRQRIAVAEAGSDSFLQRCNLAGYLLLDARDAEATELIHGLSTELESNGLDESYLRYYAGALFVAAAALQGDVVGALSAHDSMADLVRSINWPNAPYVRRRHQLLRPMLDQLPQNRQEADVCLLASRPSEIGSAWRHYARLVPLCELDFFLDS